MIDVEYWKNRGREDQRRDRFPLFRSTRRFGVIADGDHQPPFASDEDETEAGTAYLEGFEEDQSYTVG